MPTFLTKLNIENYNKKHLGIIFLAGVLLVIIAMPTSVNETEEDSFIIDDSGQNQEYSEMIESSEWDYKTLMEDQLADILRQVDGVGEVAVMITLQSTSTKLVEKDIYTTSDSSEENTIYTESEAGEEPYVYQQIYPTIQGVVVSVTGGDNAIVVKNITEAIQALFDVDTHKIKIMKMISD